MRIQILILGFKGLKGGLLLLKASKERRRVTSVRNGVYVAVQFYPWFKFYFLLFLLRG